MQGRPLLNSWLCLLSAATALLVPPSNYQHVRHPAKQQQALVMHAGSCESIPELRDVYELAPLMTYDGWEEDVGSVENEWARGRHVDIQTEVGTMRRKQCLHEGGRSDAALQMLDDVKQGLTYAGWEEDVGSAERRWARDGHVDIQREVGMMRRKQRLHDVLSEEADASGRVAEASLKPKLD